MSVVCSKDGQWDAIQILLGAISIPLKFNLYMEVMISVQDGAARSTDRLSLNVIQFTVPRQVHCDMANRGWTTFMRKSTFNESTMNFGWTAYKNGFGDLEGDFWMGNEFLHRISTQKKLKMLIQLTVRGHRSVLGIWRCSSSLLVIRGHRSDSDNLKKSSSRGRHSPCLHPFFL